MGTDGEESCEELKDGAIHTNACVFSLDGSILNRLSIGVWSDVCALHLANVQTAIIIHSCIDDVCDYRNHGVHSAPIQSYKMAAHLVGSIQLDPTSLRVERFRLAMAVQCQFCGGGNSAVDEYNKAMVQKRSGGKWFR